MKAKPTYRLTLGVLFLLCFILGGCTLDRKVRTFSSCRSLMSSDLAARGWVPAQFPARCAKVHFEWDIDTNLTWAKFTLVRGEREKLLRGVAPADNRDLRVSIQPKMIPWKENLVQDRQIVSVVSSKRQNNFSISLDEEEVYFWAFTQPPSSTRGPLVAPESGRP